MLYPKEGCSPNSGISSELLCRGRDFVVGHCFLFVVLLNIDTENENTVGCFCQEKIHNFVLLLCNFDQG